MIHAAKQSKGAGGRDFEKPKHFKACSNHPDPDPDPTLFLKISTDSHIASTNKAKDPHLERDVLAILYASRYLPSKGATSDCGVTSDKP